MNCTEPACIDEWKRIEAIWERAGVSIMDDKGGYEMQHCEIPGCHDIYPAFNQGGECEKCGIKMCSVCSCEGNRMMDNDPELEERCEEETICVECIKKYYLS